MRVNVPGWTAQSGDPSLHIATNISVKIGNVPATAVECLYVQVAYLILIHQKAWKPNAHKGCQRERERFVTIL